MKKISLLLALAAVAGAAHSQTTIYDTVSTAASPTYYTGAGNNLAGDNFFPTATAAGFHYRITSLSFVSYATAAGAISAPVTVRLYNGVGVSATTTDPALTGLAGGFTTNVAFTSTGAGNGVIVTVPNLSIDLASTALNPLAGYGISFSYGTNTGSTAVLTQGYGNNPSAVGGYSNGFFIDLNSSGVLQNNEFVNFTGFTAGNALFSLSATQVVNATPEPSAFAALGVGALALLRRRKRA